MKILFNNDTDFILDTETFNLIKSCILQTLKTENFTTNVEISLSIVDNKEIQELNKTYRQIDKATDVLSFPLLDCFDNVDDKNIVALGDIIISIEKAKEQALEYGHSLERELCFLTVHSMLHLLGYDHMQEDEEKIMFSKQDNILDSLNITR